MTIPAVRIAATADLHVRTRDDLSFLQHALQDLESEADLLIIAGDLTEMGLLAEMELLADVLREVPIPIFAIFGNHDRRGMRRSALKKELRGVGAIVLEGSGAVATMPTGQTIGIAGVTGTGGGFKPEGEEFGPGARFTRAAMVKSRRESARLRKVLKDLCLQQPDMLIVLSHFSPTPTTLQGEPPLKYWMLGNALLGRTIDEFDVDLVIHGHAHLGNEVGTTEAGAPVLNVALPIVGGIRIVHLDEDGTIISTGLRPIASPLVTTGVRESDLR